MAVNKIVLNTDDGEQVLVDLTGDTVTPETLADGITAHDASGAAIVGTHVCESGGGGADDAFEQFIEGSLAELNSNATSVAVRRFENDQILKTVNLPQATEIGKYAFLNCYGLKTVKIPKVRTIDGYAFQSNKSLCMVDCSELQSVDVGAFATSNLQALVIRNTSNVVNAVSALHETPIANGDGYIYVPRDMIDVYLTHRDQYGYIIWRDFLDQFRALEDYTVDGTINGELDIDFGGSGIELSVYIFNMETYEQEFAFAITAAEDMTWSEWLSDEENAGGVWSATDDGYVVCMGEYYVFHPSGVLMTTSDPVMYMGDDNAVLLLHADYAQDLM